MACAGHRSYHLKDVLPSELQVLGLQRHGKTWKGQVKGVNKGGVVVDVYGMRGFIPLSRLSPDRLQAIERQEDQTGLPIAAKVIQVCQWIAAVSCSDAQHL